MGKVMHIPTIINIGHLADSANFKHDYINKKYRGLILMTFEMPKTLHFYLPITKRPILSLLPLIKPEI